jgi:hypothetical protein
MTYIIRKTNGTTLGTILDGTIDNRAVTSLQLMGRNYANYGQIMTDNLVSMLENWANTGPPANPLAGQLWWSTQDNRLRVYTGNAFKVVSSSTAQSTAPTAAAAGDLWWDITNKQLYVYDGTDPYNVSGWILIGPQRNGSGVFWEQITDTLGTTHQVLSEYLNYARVAIISNEEFTPAVAIPGFTTVKTGYNIQSTMQFVGNATNSLALANVAASSYLRNDQSGSIQGSLTVTSASGLTIGNSANLNIAARSDGTAQITNSINNADVVIRANVAGVSTQAIKINGSDGSVSLTDAIVAGNLDVGANATITGSLEIAGRSNFSGLVTATSMPAGTANSAVATTEFVVNSSGFAKNKIYANTESYVQVNDTGAGNLMVALDGAVVATASANGFNLSAGATAVTQPDSHNSTGNARIATTQFVKTATQWWGGSAKFVSTAAPDPGVNDQGSQDGDFWFQYTL